MSWVVFSYSLPSKAAVSARVAVWRRLWRLGAISPAGGIHVLPARDEGVEAFQWLAQEVQEAKGEALVLHVERCEGVSDTQLIELFRRARSQEYAEIDARAAELERHITARSKSQQRARPPELLDKLRRRHAEVARMDFFDALEGSQVASRLARIEQALAPRDSVAVSVSPSAIAAYRGRRWVTRPRPHVDRLGCLWLIRRFIDPDAVGRAFTMGYYSWKGGLL
jgi:hypothetical protein